MNDAQVQLAFGAATDVGRVRQVNEDAYLVAPPVFVVADGMGGHDGGDVASRTVVEELEALGGSTHDAASGAAAVREALDRAQERVAAWSREHGGGRGRASYAGTTAVLALLVRGDDGPAWLVANLGDSRAYRLLDDRLEQVSVDHSLVQELVDAGTITPEQAAVHPERNVVTRAVGGTERGEVDFFLLPLPAGRLLLCSDGVNGMLDHATLQEVVAAVADPTDCAERVVAAAVEAGGEDNATAVVVDTTTA
ncbi:protein phosphatase 2C domain-containing protein [Nocardioides perillae]|uniref:Protein phosphatase n=1 Tax=Nocardioides perillae TaxID=1119534 RepID=A0A7Y9RVH5_9ACTN|nr:protein phosphatase [Nocardioides perillae]